MTRCCSESAHARMSSVQKKNIFQRHSTMRHKMPGRVKYRRNKQRTLRTAKHKHPHASDVWHGVTRAATHVRSYIYIYTRVGVSVSKDRQRARGGRREGRGGAGGCRKCTTQSRPVRKVTTRGESATRETGRRGMAGKAGRSATPATAGGRQRCRHGSASATQRQRHYRTVTDARGRRGCANHCPWRVAADPALRSAATRGPTCQAPAGAARQLGCYATARSA